MAGKTVATGYVELRVDDSKLEPSVKDKAAKVSREFGSRLGKELRALDLEPIDLNVDPRQARQAIDDTERRLRQLSDEAATAEIRIKTEAALAGLDRLRKKIGDVGEEAGPEAAAGFAARFGARIGPLLASAPVSPAILAAAAPAAVGVSALLAGAVVGAAGVGGVVGGMVIAARDQRVKDASSDLGAVILADLQRRAAGFVQPMLGGIDRVRAGWADVGDDLTRIFRASRFVEPLIDGVVDGAKGLISGFADAVDEADPVIESLRQMFAGIGTAVGDTFSLLSEDAGAGASAIEDLTLALTNFITVSGQLIHVGAVMKDYSDQLDTWIDRGRYWIEDNNRFIGGLAGVNDQIDLTADGFKAGSVEAEAYRKATLGTATAADFAALKQAGYTDAKIAGIDASGKYRAELERVRAQTAAAGTANENLVATQEQVTEAQQAATQAQQAYKRTLDELAPGLGRATQLAQGLRTAQQNLYGAAIAGSEANEAYQASWDALSESVKKNKGSLDVNTAAGRANRDSLQALLGASNEMYFANIAQGQSTDQARKKHEERTKAVREEARRLGLNKAETESLIKTYGKIPPKKQTEIIQKGLEAVAARLTDLYWLQRSLAEGKPFLEIKRAEQARKSGPPQFKGLAEGGQVTGAGPKGVDSVPILAAPGEFMQRTAAVDYYGVAAMRALNNRQIPREALRGYAAGGLIAPVETSGRYRFPVDLSETFVMSKKAALAKVIPAVPTAGATAPFMERLLERMFGVQMISGFRPGSRTLSGNLSWHARNKAVDFPPVKAMAAYMDATYGPRMLEIITPWQQYNRLRGRRHRYTGAVWNQHNFAGGNAHNHFAMARGGVIREEIFGVGRSGRTYSFGEGGRPETVTPGLPGGGGNTYHITVDVPVGAHPAETGRQVVEAIKAYETSNGSRWRER